MVVEEHSGTVEQHFIAGVVAYIWGSSHLLWAFVLTHDKWRRVAQCELRSLRTVPDSVTPVSYDLSGDAVKLEDDGTVYCLDSPLRWPWSAGMMRAP